jgi:hypothetical protein
MVSFLGITNAADDKKTPASSSPQKEQSLSSSRIGISTGGPGLGVVTGRSSDGETRQMPLSPNEEGRRESGRLLSQQQCAEVRSTTLSIYIFMKIITVALPVLFVRIKFTSEQKGFPPAFGAPVN